MFSRKTVIVASVIFFIAATAIVITISSMRRYHSIGPMIPAPFQEVTTGSISYLKSLWRHYFHLVSVARENDRLKKKLSISRERENRCLEIEAANSRLRGLLEFRQNTPLDFIAAEVVGKDPSPWHKSITINKGGSDGVEKGAAVVVPEGIVGLVMDASDYYSRVLLIIDKNSAVDALVQRTRARGIVKGESGNSCIFTYALRKDDIQKNDTVVTSGLDGVFPKGLGIGEIADVDKGGSDIFQNVTVTPHVDFEKLEEVFIVNRNEKADR